ncbi:cellulose-binding protein [Marinobacter sp. Arc7-DN-1]|uniref:cellulose-binding protein n=1 Tax=Marinobacter sp. Arc7-DN-1 TaxID=2304594 RepID=UPI000E42F728|nr:cellulose-binding protein [Marinobacter sp. Arc7-DN-1]AXS81887.1 cellulose-binding protein [Marinobacter sp. Arc7-DN-1]
METLAKYFDHYVISARIKPSFFVVLPIALTTLAWWPEVQEFGGAIMAFLLAFGVIGFLSNWVSNRGNRMQTRLFSKWGGAPTTLLLRHSDSKLDDYSKQRYHQNLEGRINGLSLPTRQEELADPRCADARYESATNFLRENTRDKKKYPMIYTDNVAYGYARNLLALRDLGLVSAVVAVTVNTTFLVGGAEVLTTQRLFHNWAGLGALSVSAIFLFIFLFIVNERHVYWRAIRYAKSLLAACEHKSL